MLLKFGKENVINSESDVLDDKQDVYKRLEETLHHDKASVRVFTLGLVHNILKVYCDKDYKYTDFDRNLISEFYRSNAATMR